MDMAENKCKLPPHRPSSGHRGRMAPKGVSSRWEMQAVVKVRVGGGWKGAPGGSTSRAQHPQ